MRILLIGGTGTISSAITRQLAESGHDLWLLNRGTRKDEVPASVKPHPELQVEDPEFDQWCGRVIEAQEKAKQLIIDKS